MRHFFAGSRKAVDDPTCLMKDPSWTAQDQYVVKALINACCAGEPRSVVYAKEDANKPRTPDDYCKPAGYTRYVTAKVRKHMHKVCLLTFT